jgi:membrane-associated phospholipid phosphatase
MAVTAGPGADARRRENAAGVVTVSLLAALALGALFGLMAQRAVTLGVAAWPNPSVQGFALTHRTEWMTAVMRSLTWAGSSTVLALLIVAAGGALLVRRRDVRPLLWLAAGLVGANLLFRIAKVLVAQPRPSAALHLASASGYGFPSGHATSAIACWGMLAVVLSLGRSRRYAITIATGSTLVVLLVGASRVYLGVHWWTDVAAGLTLGGSWLCILCAAFFASRSSGPRRAGLSLRRDPGRWARASGAAGAPRERRSPPSPPGPPGPRRSSGG